MTEDPTDGYHNYTTIWTKEQLEWWLDDRLIRTLKFADAKGGDRYPQVLMSFSVFHRPRLTGSSRPLPPSASVSGPPATPATKTRA